MIYLLQREKSKAKFENFRVCLLGEEWILVKYSDLSEAPEFTCASYEWGSERVVSPLNHHQEISSRTISVLETIIAASKQPLFLDGSESALNAMNALWIDGLCLPQKEPELSNCLRSIGEVYRCASQVVVVLGTECAPIFDGIRHKKIINVEDLDLLENDRWSTRVWTYQEVVNGKKTYITSEHCTVSPIDLTEFLEYLCIATDKQRTALGIDTLTWSKEYPRLDEFENTSAAAMQAEHSGRPAYQILTAMKDRNQSIDSDYFYAMAGAIQETKKLDINPQQITSPSEFFMMICEESNDFSYIFNTAPRSDKPGKTWRPIEGRYPPILFGTNAFGFGLNGKLHTEFLELSNVSLVSPLPLSVAGVKALEVLVRNNPDYIKEKNIEKSILMYLCEKSFLGSGECFAVGDGLFFPQVMLSEPGRFQVVLCTGVQWRCGCPGMLLRSNANDVFEFVSIGVFAGLVPTGTQSVRIA